MKRSTESKMRLITVSRDNVQALLPREVYLDRLCDNPAKDQLTIRFTDKDNNRYTFEFQRVIAYRNILEEFALVREDIKDEQVTPVRIIEKSPWFRELVEHEPQFKLIHEDQNRTYHFCFITPVSVTDVLCESMPELCIDKQKN